MGQEENQHSRAQEPILVKRKSTRILSISNQKGGVGKTTTAINLATALSACDQRVLLVDLDPQANASTSLGVNGNACKHNVYNVLLGDAKAGDAIVSTMFPAIDIITATQDLTGAEVELINFKSRESILLEALKQVIGKYDYILIDCPPALGLLTLNALVAAEGVIVPLQCEFFALEGLSRLVKTVSRIRLTLNAQINIQGILLTMYDRRNNLCVTVERDVRRYFGDKVFRTVIPRNVRVSEAPSFGKPVIVYDANCLGSRAYLSFASEFLRREEFLLNTDAA